MRQTSFLASILLVTAGLTVSSGQVLAQTATECQPPAQNEYLLLVLNETSDVPQHLQRTLPSNAQINVCRYLNDFVTRIGGLKSLDDANKWAQYINDIAGLKAVVARPAPATATTFTAPATNFTTANPGTINLSTAVPGNSTVVVPTTTFSTPTTQVYNSQNLGNVYAVLVDYANNPDVAAQIKQLTGSDAALVMFGSQQYLLAVHTTSPNEASNALRQLSDRGLLTMMVDGRKVMWVPR